MRGPILIKYWMRYPSRIIVLIHIKNNEGSYATKICKELNVTQKNIWDVLKYLSEKELIYKVKDKKKKFIYLTEKGKILAEQLIKVESLCK